MAAGRPFRNAVDGIEPGTIEMIKRHPSPARFAVRTLAGIALVVFSALPESATPGQEPGYSIPFHTISAGGRTLGNDCYRLSGTLAETAPGYSGSSLYSIYAGFWRPSFDAAADEIFFNAFEGCRS